MTQDTPSPSIMAANSASYSEFESHRLHDGYEQSVNCSYFLPRGFWHLFLYMWEKYDNLCPIYGLF